MRNDTLAKSGEGFLIGAFDIIVFMRFLAKVGHSFATARLGAAHYRPVLTDIILGKSDVLINTLAQYIGGADPMPIATWTDPTLSTLHGMGTTGIRA